MSEKDFVIRAIKKLIKTPYKSIHSVYSVFNQAFKEYFNKDPMEFTKRLVQEGKIVSRPVKGGATLYLPKDAAQLPFGARWGTDFRNKKPLTT